MFLLAVPRMFLGFNRSLRDSCGSDFRARWVGLAVWLALFLVFSSARGATLGDRVLDNRALLSSSSVLRDAEGRLSWREAMAAAREFVPLDRPFGAGYVRDVYWYRIEVSRSASADSAWYLQVDPAYLDDVTLHHLGDDGRVLLTQRAGDRVPMNRLALDHRTTVFRLSLPEGRSTLLLRISTRSTMAVLPKLIPAALSSRTWQWEYFLYGLYYGGIAVACVAGMVGLIFLRQRVYAAYSVYVAALAFQWFAINGFLHQILSPEWPFLADQIIAMSLSLTGAATHVLYTTFFGFQRLAPWLHRFVIWTAIVMLGAAVLPFVPGQYTATPLTLALHLGVLVLSIQPLSRVWRTQGGQGRLGICALLLSAALAHWNILTVLGVLAPSTWSLVGGQLATLFQVLLLVSVMYRETYLVRRDLRQAELRASTAQSQIESERLARVEQGHLIAMMAHEIRTPVAVIDAAVQSLEVLDEQATPERTRRYERISRAVQRMGHMVELALAHDRMDVIEWHRDLGAVCLETLTRDVMETLGGTVKSRVVVTRASSCEPIQADARMLKFALLNMLDNAEKYSPKGSEIRVDISVASCAGRTGCLWVIRDQGRGIPVVDRERVFQKYFRAAETSGSPGLGLGLYLVRGIVNRHDGWVRCVEPIDGGACFECWLPNRQREPES